MVDCTNRQQGRHRNRGGRELGSGTGSIDPVGEDQHLSSVAHGLLSLLTKGIKGRLEATGTGFNGHLGGQGRGRKTLLADGRQLLLIEHGCLEVDHGGRLCLRFQRGTTLTQVHLQTHHQLFPQGVDRRVGDLSEPLLEIVVEQVRFIGENRKGNVITHAVSGFLAQSGHVFDDQIEVLSGEAHRRLQPQQIKLTHLLILRPGLGGKSAAMLFQPVAVGKA